MDSSIQNIVRNWLPFTSTCDSISICGYSHELNGKECQDASCFWKEKNYSGIIVCDGHGGEKYIRSATGAKLACEVGRSALSDFMAEALRKKSRIFQTKHSIDDNLNRLQRTITMLWREAVIADVKEHPVGDDERFSVLSDAERTSICADSGVKAYGTTFLAGVMSKEFLFILKLGDGNACVVLDNGSVILPDELSDPQLQFNFTTSLCSSDADIRFRNYFMRMDESSRPVAIILSSDGVINCYHSEDAFKSFIKNISDAYVQESVSDAHSELEDALNTLSKKGSGDDLSIAIVRLNGPVEAKEA